MHSDLKTEEFYESSSQIGSTTTPKFGVAPITIGMAVRNEENTVYDALTSILRAVNYTCERVTSFEYEILICLNGCTDNSESEVDRLIHDHPNANIRCIHSAPGLVKAQREIVRQRKHSGLSFFFDADILVEEDCLYHLVVELHSDPNVEAVYATCRPFTTAHGVTHSIFLSKDNSPDLISQRFYLHGRAFGIRKWDIPDFGEAQTLPPSVASCIEDGGLAHLQLEKGPIVDDIYLSYAIVNKYGFQAIKQCKQARVHYAPTVTLTDYYKSRRRVVIEKARLFHLYPEYKLIEQKFHRKVNWRVFLRLPMAWKAGLLCLILLDILFDVIARIEIWLARFGVKSLRGDLFTYHPSTKQSITIR